LYSLIKAMLSSLHNRGNRTIFVVIYEENAL